jgi:hypothetical protein
MEAYDENLDRFVNIVIQDQQRSINLYLIEEAAPIVIDAISKLDEMII